jgi:hypothetical protein
MDRSTKGGEMRANKFVRLGVIGLAVGALFASAPAAMASGGGGGVTTKGACSAGAKWKLGLRPEDGGVLKVQLEVEEATPGQQWSVRIADNGTRIFSGSRTTNEFGKFRVRKSTTDLAGSDHVTARATNTVSGQVCNASATI